MRNERGLPASVVLRSDERVGKGATARRINRPEGSAASRLSAVLHTAPVPAMHGEARGCSDSPRGMAAQSAWTVADGTCGRAEFHPEGRAGSVPGCDSGGAWRQNTG